MTENKTTEGEGRKVGKEESTRYEGAGDVRESG